MLDKLLETFRPRHRLTPEQYLAKLTAKGLNPDGSPKLDPTPMAPPLGYKKAPSMIEIVRDMVRGEKLRQEALASGHETFEESEDFDVDDDGTMMPSPWENEFDPPIETLLAAGREALAARSKSDQAEPRSPIAPDPIPNSGGSGAKPPRKAPAPAAPVPDEP